MFLIDSSHDLVTSTRELIAEKIVQPARFPGISRPRLLSILEKSMAAGTSTILSGRAGSGKTTLAVDFANHCGRQVAWYKVDAPDADPKLFFPYLIKSIQERRPGFGTKSLLPLAWVEDLDNVSGLSDSFVYELSEGEICGPLLIVIEDLHLVCDSEWLVPFFRRLLHFSLPKCTCLSPSGFAAAPFVENGSKQSLVVSTRKRSLLRARIPSPSFKDWSFPTNRPALL